MAYSVPPLPYDYDALEPHIDERTMQIHHDKHHQAYVDKVNAALEGTEWADRPIEEVLTNLGRSPTTSGRPCATTAAATTTTRSSGRAWARTAAASPTATSAPRSTTPSAPSPTSREAQGRRRQPVRLRLGLARPRRRRARGRLHGQPGQPDLGRQDAAPRRRRLGARLLPHVPEPPPRLPRRVVEHGRLGRWQSASPPRRPASTEMPALKICFSP